MSIQVYARDVVSSKKKIAQCSNNNHADSQGTATIPHDNKLIHEHDLIPARIKERGFYLVHCTGCGIYYCKLCGKAL
jgi:hypothetical protein